MKKQKEITISGVGGQGMILCGTLLAEAAVLHDHKKATLSSEYGVETRGTFAKSDVIISDEDICFPDVTEPDLVVCLHQIAYQRYSGKIGDRSLLLYNSDEVTPAPQRTGHEKGLPISTMARTAGSPATANILTMGIIAGLLDAVSKDGAEDAIQHFFARKSEKIILMNKQAFETGFTAGKELR